VAVAEAVVLVVSVETAQAITVVLAEQAKTFQRFVAKLPLPLFVVVVAVEVLRVAAVVRLVRVVERRATQTQTLAQTQQAAAAAEFLVATKVQVVAVSFS
jgi:hypothetical protein